MIKRIYGLTIALSAFLLFSVEPMVTRALLPALGGSSAVWLTALAFFQLLLLVGYAYSSWVASASAQRQLRTAVHGGLLALAMPSLLLPQTTAWTATGQAPQIRLFVLLTTWIGLPFFVLSTTAPLLQAWYARREHLPVPYRLFGLSNLASLVALLTYPTLFEPRLMLSTQWLLWKCGFVIYACLAGFLTFRMRTADAAVTYLSAAQPTQAHRSVRILWFALPAVASMQLAAVTQHLTQDVAALPLLWVVPLAAYLITFVLAFDFPRLYQRKLVLGMVAVLLFALGYFLTLTTVNVPIGISIVLFTAELLFAAWFCHAELFALRPEQAHASTSFYLHIAAGGAAGTLAVAVVSPLLTDSNFDLPTSFLLTAAVILYVTWPEGWRFRLLWGVGTALGIALLGTLHATYEQDSLLRARNFYGTIRVKQSLAPPQAYISRSLYNGAIQHGMQWFSDAFHHTPLTYYAPDSGVGLALAGCCDPAHARRIGVIGLGTGTLAAYGRPSDQIRFYEINQQVTDVAQHLFTYTRDTPAAVTVVPGDARLTLASEAPQKFDVLVIDAFSGDSIPVHLLTSEALALYRRHLAPGGVLAFHISNQYLDLAPVLARLVDSTHSGTGQPLEAREVESGPDDSRGEALAYWVLITNRAQLFAQPELASRAKPIQTQADVRLWTDQYSSLLPIVRWTGRHR